MKGNPKIQTLDELTKLLAAFRSERPRKRIIHCHGVFDLLHIGHIRYLEQAKRLGDLLIVTVTPDRYVNKGPHRPAFPESLRVEAVAALDCVDYVAMNTWPTAVETIALLKPDVYAKGAEYRENRTEEIRREEAIMTSIGGEVVFIEDLTSSSSLLINRHLDIFPEEIRTYLEEFAARYTPDEIISYIERVHPLKVLVIGEAIIDEYQYCESIGKSAKEPALAARYLSTELFAGGVLAVSNHVAGFCDHASLLTFLGSQDSQEAFVQQHVKPHVKRMFLYKENAPTIVKRRFIENYLLSKFFEIYIIDDRELNEAEQQALCTRLSACLPEYDAVIVADFGHGMLTRKVVDLLCHEAPWLAVNTQVNAGNGGFNTISKYPRADYICLAEHEIRMETHNRGGDLRTMILDVSKRLGCDRIVITRGKYGSLCYSKEEGFFEVPAFATRVVDRIGAGDAVFSLTALCVAKNVPMEVVGFIGNVVGAQAVAIIGNRMSIERAPLLRHVVSLLK